MGFGFATPDQATAQPPVDPTAVAPQASASPEPYKPSILDILQGVVFDGQSPANAAMAARGRDFALQQQRYGIQRQQMLMDTLKNASPDQRLAMLLNPDKLGEAVASRFTSMALKGGETRNNGEGGPADFTAPMLGFDDKSGGGYQVGAGGMLSTGGAKLPGDFSISPTGAVSSGRTGPTGQTINLPQIVPAGSGPGSFRPTVSGPGGAPQVAPVGPISKLPSVHTAIDPASVVTPQGQLDPGAFFKSFVLPHEGGWNARDLNGAPTKYGINQAANPDVDVSKLTPEGAQAVFAKKYFPSSAGLPPALAAVNADTAFINPRKAATFLQQSGGDPAKYMDLREGWLNGLVQKNPAAQQYAQAWTNRNADLRALATKLGGGAPAAAGQQSTGSAEGWTGGQPRQPRLLSADEVEKAGFPTGSVVQQAPNRDVSVVQAPEFSPSERSKMRQQFLESEGYKGNVAASSALQALTQNIGKMTGPSAYSILDTFARTINPGAVARQGTLSAIEESLGLPAHLVGSLQNMVGQGKIPLQTQQQILDAVTPFAQSHWDQAKLMYDANTSLAKSKKLDPNEVTAPIGNRPERMIAAPGGAVSMAAAIEQAKAALAHGAPPAAVAARLHAYGIDPAVLH